MIEATSLAERYVNVWNEPDLSARKQAIANLWAPEGEHFVKTLEARGYEALEKRVTGSHEKNVRDRGFRFRARDAQALRNVVTFSWEMFPAAGGSVAATGLQFLVLNDDGRILTDYQFITG